MIGEQEVGDGIKILQVLLAIHTGEVLWMTAVLPPTGTRPTPALTTNMATRLWTGTKDATQKGNSGAFVFLQKCLFFGTQAPFYTEKIKMSFTSP